MRAPGPRSVDTVTAIVLAAGASTRMGRPKLLLPLQGRPLLDHALSTVREAGVRRLVVVLGPDAARIRRQVPMGDAVVVLNPDFRRGISTSIRVGAELAKKDSEAFLIVLADQPFVRAGTIVALGRAWSQSRAKILVPSFRGRRGNPVLLDRSLLPELKALEGDEGFRAVLPRHSEDVEAVAVDDPGILLDLDTPEEFERVSEGLARGASLEELSAARVRDEVTGPRAAASRSRRTP